MRWCEGGHTWSTSPQSRTFNQVQQCYRLKHPPFRAWVLTSLQASNFMHLCLYHDPHSQQLRPFGHVLRTLRKTILSGYLMPSLGNNILPMNTDLPQYTKRDWSRTLDVGCSPQWCPLLRLPCWFPPSYVLCCLLCSTRSYLTRCFQEPSQYNASFEVVCDNNILFAYFYLFNTSTRKPPGWLSCRQPMMQTDFFPRGCTWVGFDQEFINYRPFHSVDYERL